MKHIFSIAAIAFLLYIFTFYVDGEMGMILITSMLAAPLLSLVLTLYGRKRIKVSFDCEAYVKKNAELLIKVRVEKEGRIPLPFVEIVPFVSAGFKPVDKIYRLSLVREDLAEFTIPVTAEIGGNAYASIKQVYSCGFLGFIRFKTKLELPQPKSIGIIPEIPEIKASSMLFRSIADTVMTSENDEENDTALLFSANTAVGYEHREYTNGDPLKRINWKLSSKKQKLMVRLDEAASSVQPLIVLDLYRNSAVSERDSMLREEKLLRAVFGLVILLIKQGIACSIMYRSYNGEIVTESIDNPDYPAQLLLKVLAVKPDTDSHIAVQISDSFCSCILASTDLSGEFSGVVSELPDKENACAVVPGIECGTASGIAVWYLDDDNNFKLV